MKNKTQEEEQGEGAIFFNKAMFQLFKSGVVDLEIPGLPNRGMHYCILR